MEIEGLWDLGSDFINLPTSSQDAHRSSLLNGNGLVIFAVNVIQDSTRILITEH